MNIVSDRNENNQKQLKYDIVVNRANPILENVRFNFCLPNLPLLKTHNNQCYLTGSLLFAPLIY